MWEQVTTLYLLSARNFENLEDRVLVVFVLGNPICLQLFFDFTSSTILKTPTFLVRNHPILLNLYSCSGYCSLLGTCAEVRLGKILHFRLHHRLLAYRIRRSCLRAFRAKFQFHWLID